jgi:hypothetical protein
MIGQDPQALGSGLVSAVAVRVTVGVKTGVEDTVMVRVAVSVNVGNTGVKVAVTVSVLAGWAGLQAVNRKRSEAHKRNEYLMALVT